MGYIDVENKNIVLNPKYYRQHKYNDYLVDNDMFHEQKNMNNDSFRQSLIAAEQKSADTTTPIVTTSDDIKQLKIDASLVPEFVEDMLGMFNSIKYGFPNGMSEQK